NKRVGLLVLCNNNIYITKKIIPRYPLNLYKNHLNKRQLIYILQPGGAISHFNRIIKKVKQL
ncbi:MAG TPA: hypothetical protein DCO75_09895, partial [Fibrobacteres bacterium]|nr:hypothetical protein [Fibrobacterota bacterium]